MSLYARIDERDVSVQTCTIKIGQNKIGTMELLIPLKPFLEEGLSERTVRADLKYKSIAIYNNNILLRSGYIKDVTRAKLGSNEIYASLKCEDEIGRLALLWSKPNAHYQDVLVTSILPDLLTLASDWELGDTSTMDDINATTTINLRAKDRLWAQIISMCESVPKVYVRYGGINPVSSNHKLDIGFFGEQDDDERYALQGQNIIGNPKIKRSSSEPIRRIRPRGGRGGGDVITLVGTESVPTGFSMNFDVPTGAYYIQNDNLATGADVARPYNQIRTANTEPPSSAELVEVRQALADATVRDLQASDEHEIIDLTCTLASVPLIGQNMQVRSKADVPIIDVLTLRETYHNIQDIDGSYRITQVKMNYKKTDGAIDIASPLIQNRKEHLEFDLQITDGLDIADYDEATYLAKRFEQHEESEPFGAGIGLGGKYLIGQYEGTGQVSDCTDVFNGITITFPFDPVPSGSVKSVSWQLISVSDTNDTAVIQAPTPSLPLILCVSGTGGLDWTTSNEVTVVIEYTYFT